MSFEFVRAGKFRVSVFHIVSVQFNDDGTAVIHTASHGIRVEDPSEVATLLELTGEKLPPVPQTPATPEPGAVAGE